MNSVPPTASRPLDELLADLEKLFQDREKNSPASQWEMVSLPLLGEVVQALRHSLQSSEGSPALSASDQYLLAAVKHRRLQERKRAGEDVEEELDALLEEMDALWDALSPAELVVVQEHLDALRRSPPAPASGGTQP